MFVVFGGMGDMDGGANDTGSCFLFDLFCIFIGYFRTKSMGFGG